MEKCQRIRSLFLAPAESYTLRQVAKLTDIPARALRREVARGGHDATKECRQWRFAWRQAACIAMQRWTLAEIQDALGSDAANVLPPLLTLRAVTVRLPEFIVRALEAVAADDGTTLEHTLYGELIDFAGTRTDQLETRIPGYRRAYLFPGRE